MAPGVGIAPTSPRLQRGANLPQLPRVLAHGHHFEVQPFVRFSQVNWLEEPKLEEQRLVVPRGNAPRSPGYRPGALLLSYRTGKLNWEALVLSASRCFCLVQEGYFRHRAALGFGVH